MNLDNLKKCDPLSQVIFVHDYIQLILQDCIITVCNASEIKPFNKEPTSSGKQGFADELIKLIDSTIIDVSYLENKVLALVFSNNYKFSVLLNSESASSPEAFEISGGPIKQIIVEQNV
jgi:hypothetical protein